MLLLLLSFETYYPGKKGAELRKLLITDCKKNHKTLGYNRAREEMYGYVYNSPSDQAVYCEYTNSRMPCKYDSMDTQCNDDLNCEHVVPQSFFGKSDPMVSDLHHLRVAWSTVNGARANYPFKALSSVSSWYGPGFKESSSTPSDKSLWSGVKSGQFMPRDGAKGDIARAVAYFYTRYPHEAGSITQTFASIDDMIDWDNQFPATTLQHQQYLKAKEVQGNINPFMEERGLVGRAYCDLSKSHSCNNY